MATLFGAFSRRNRLHLGLLLGAASLAIFYAGCATPTEHDLPGDNGGDDGLSGASGAGAPGAGAPGAGAVGSAGSPTGGAGAPAGGATGFGGATSGGAPNGGAMNGGGAPGAGAPAGGAPAGGAPGAGAPGAGAPGAGAPGAGAASGGATGSGGSTGGMGCNAAGWVQGKTYGNGDVVTGTCSVIGGGATVCSSGKKYPWTCIGTTCNIYGPGADGWWANWMPGTACN